MRDVRHRQLDLLADLDRAIREPRTSTHRQLVQVYDGGAIPTTTPRVFLTNPVTMDAADTEGASWSASADGSVTIPVVVIGSQAPSAGDLLIAHALGGRWLAERGAGSGGGTCGDFTILGCDGSGLAGATVDVYDHLGGTLLDSGATDSSGNVTLSWSGSCAVYVTVAATNYTTWANSVTLPPGIPYRITLSWDGSSAICCTNCLVEKGPMSLTLTYSPGCAGGPCTTSATLTWYAASNSWQGVAPPTACNPFPFNFVLFCEGLQLLGWPAGAHTCNPFSATFTETLEGCITTAVVTQ